jgi:hypothetical protein
MKPLRTYPPFVEVLSSMERIYDLTARVARGMLPKATSPG